MRYIPTGCLREGMTLARNLYGANNELVLAHGQRLNERYIYKLHRLGYSGIYIDDDISRDIEIVNVIKDELRQKSVVTLKNVFASTASHDEKKIEKNVDDSKGLVYNMVDDIMSNRSVMFNMIDLKVYNDYTFYHSVNVAVLAILLGMGMGYNYTNLYKLGLGALLHDVGKVFLPEAILNKPAALTREEFCEMKKHPKIGYDYLSKNCSLPTEAHSVSLQHHERFDGTGYPYGLAGDNISLNGRVTAVSDVYDAMVSDRPYRRALPRAEAIEYIISANDTLFDPEVVDVFFRKIAPYPVGSMVRLSNGERGLVILNHENFGSRPDVRILSDDNEVVKDVSLMDDMEYLSVTVISCDV